MISLDYKDVYLSGPMTGIEDYNIPEFAAAHAKILATHPQVGSIYDPGQEALGKKLRGKHSYWIARSISALTSGAYMCLISLPGWDKSEGAVLERTVAEACDIACYELEEVLA